MANFKNASTHKGKGKHWGKLTGSVKSETTEGPSTGHKSGGTPSSKFLGGTKGNRDLNPNRTAGGPKQGAYAGK